VVKQAPLARRRGLNPGCGLKPYQDEIAARLALIGPGWQDSATRHENSGGKEPRFHEACGSWHLYPAGTGLARKPGERAPRAPGKPRKAPKDTGPDAATRKLVLERDGYACVCCGRPVTGQVYSLQHRKRRSQGGTNCPSNLLTVLGGGTTGCHARIDSRIDPHDEAQGYTVRSHDDPAQIPVMIHSAGGSGCLKWLAADGNYADTGPGGRAA
jgi:hypothetical protein